ncbi:hypothetical protein PGT21_014960 [Puccinia graminis f. sp. tritici]|uniref:Uncharacterized protein n=1 Tax=Puccinia graminis f. sp. tritici TaxID=56615 RepID=A0A5B0LXW0_PUCGR|nr:hypothetical protein PGTUg99_036521 [Puccinia graminis f. sp. tritici]KAA1104211.1 hypothetical protein PGT21_014960 [Puccinia graminis f. sp. tritici]
MFSGLIRGDALIARGTTHALAFGEMCGHQRAIGETPWATVPVSHHTEWCFNPGWVHTGFISSKMLSQPLGLDVLVEIKTDKFGNPTDPNFTKSPYGREDAVPKGPSAGKPSDLLPGGTLRVKLARTTRLGGDVPRLHSVNLSDQMRSR